MYNCPSNVVIRRRCGPTLSSYNLVFISHSHCIATAVRATKIVSKKKSSKRDGKSRFRFFSIFTQNRDFRLDSINRNSTSVCGIAISLVLKCVRRRECQWPCCRFITISRYCRRRPCDIVTDQCQAIGTLVLFNTLIMV